MKHFYSLATLVFLATATASNAGTVYQLIGEKNTLDTTGNTLTTSPDGSFSVTAGSIYIRDTFSSTPFTFDLSVAAPTANNDPDETFTFTGTYKIFNGSDSVEGIFSAVGSQPFAVGEFYFANFDSGSLTPTSTTGNPTPFNALGTFDGSSRILSDYPVVGLNLEISFADAVTPSAVPLPTSATMATTLTAASLLRRRR